MNQHSKPARVCLIAWVISVVWTGPTVWAQESLPELFDRATLELTYFNFDTAYTLFSELQDEVSPTDADLWQRATLGLALSAQSKTPATREALAEAEAQYHALAEAAPESRYTARALLNLGRIAEVRDFGGDVVDLDTARTYYRQVFEGWPEASIADEAALRYADTFFQQFEDLATVQQGVTFLEDWARSREGQAMAAVLWEVLATVKQDQLQDYRGALDAFLIADSLGFAEPNAEGVLFYRTAQLAEDKVGDLDTAVKFYQKVITEAPRSGRAFNAQLALEAIRDEHPDMQIEIPRIKMFIADDTDSAEPGS